MNLEGYTNVQIFDREYPTDVQAEGMAVNNAVIFGHCDKCAFLKTCSTNDNFKPPVFAWCFQEKKRILANWEKCQ